MANLVLSAWERNDLLRILEYAKEKKRDDYERNKMTLEEFKQDIEKINVIKKRTLGIRYVKAYAVTKNE